MKFNIPKIVKSISLGEYDESLSEQKIWMWVNPPKKMRREFDEIQQGIREQVNLLLEASEEKKQKIKKAIEKLQAENSVWWAEMWSQSEDKETHWSVEDVEQLLEKCADKDPQLWSFLIDTSLELLKAHIVGERKK